MIGHKPPGEHYKAKDEVISEHQRRMALPYSKGKFDGISREWEDGKKWTLMILQRTIENIQAGKLGKHDIESSIKELEKLQDLKMEKEQVDEEREAYLADKHFEIEEQVDLKKGEPGLKSSKDIAMEKTYLTSKYR